MVSAYKAVNSELGLPAQPTEPRDVIPQLASALDLSSQVRRRALALADRAVANGVATGCSPSGVAAACVYQAAQERDLLLTQADVAAAAGMTPTTLWMH